jgi:branched-chain amino acid transport system substrate-binding protein
MTLSYAFVPWYFRCIPDDKQQASALIEEVCRKRKLHNIVLVGEESYDAENAMGTFVKMALAKNFPAPRKLVIKNSTEASDSPELIDLPRAEAYILFGTPALAKRFLEVYHHKGLETPLFGTISLLDDGKSHTPDQKFLDGVVTVSPEFWFTEKGKRFAERFRERYGYEAGPAAAYAYDGVGCIIEAVRSTGTNRNRVIGYLSGIQYTGATGIIRFDERGNREGPVHFLRIKKGIPALYEVVP